MSTLPCFLLRTINHWVATNIEIWDLLVSITWTKTNTVLVMSIEPHIVFMIYFCTISNSITIHIYNIHIYFVLCNH